MDHIFWNHDKVLKTFDKPVCDQWSGYDDEGLKSHVTAETALVKVPESHRLRTSFVWSRSLTKICSCLFRLLSLHSHCHVNQLRRLLVWLMFTVSDLLSEVKKKLNNDGVFFFFRATACERWAVAEQFQCCVATFRPIHPSLLSSIRGDGQVNKCTWKTSSSRHYWSASHPPHTPLLTNSQRCAPEPDVDWNRHQ